MIWATHILSAAFLAERLGADLPSIAACAAGGVLPDWIETIGRIRILRHRGLSHSVLLWSFLCSALMAFFPALLWMRYFTLGVFLHLAEDSLTMTGVPVFLKRRIAFRLVRTGGLSELLFVLAFVHVLVVFF